jgi:hypothetical protein
LYDVLLGFLAEGLNGRLFGDFFGSVSDDGYFLSPCFFTILDGNFWLVVLVENNSWKF